jgi:hypothetical protein
MGHDLWASARTKMLVKAKLCEVITDTKKVFLYSLIKVINFYS